jgi:light-regulated signal transduction histidine kinase (bacteriophytochrome)/CheY-like chemotaxis protein
MSDTTPPMLSCTAAQIAAPGAIQQWGALLIADETTLLVRQASANLAAFLGTPASAAIGQTLGSVISQETLEQLLTYADRTSAPWKGLTLTPRGGSLPTLALTAHWVDGHIQVELEPAEHRGDAALRVAMPHILQSLHDARDTESLFAVAMTALRQITGYGRVHIYRFDEDGHGEVIAESHLPDHRRLLGLRFPSAYIPQPARQLLTRVGVRVIADSEAAPARLLGVGNDGCTADLSRCALRMTASCCADFLRTMGVRASATMALNVDGEIWGIIACHHGAPSPLSPAQRGMCAVIGQVTSLRLGNICNAARNEARMAQQAYLAAMSARLAAQKHDPDGLGAALAAEGGRLLALCRADGAIVRVGGRTHAVGATLGGQVDDLVVERLVALAPAGRAPTAWRALGDVLGDILPQRARVGGALLLPLAYAKDDVIVWLRNEQAETVYRVCTPQQAAGDTHFDRTFEVWKEEVRGHSAAWSPAQFDAAACLQREIEKLMASYAESMRVARETAERALQAKSEFLAKMSHEIRSPMSGLLGVLELLRGTSLDAEQSQMADLIHHSGSMLLAVLNDILDFSKIEAGAVSVTLESLDVRTLVGNVCQPLAVTAAAKGIRLHAAIDSAVPDSISTDSLRLRQVLVNLLSNALKFTHAGEITLSLRVVVGEDLAPKLRFAVRDTGIGMSAEVKNRLFAPFMQADNSTTRVYGGTGLGLCISHQLVRLLGGELGVTSVEGAGSIFSFSLPIPAGVRTAPDDVATSSRENEDAAIVAGPRVLVADDDLTNRWLTQRQLQKLGLVVDSVENGEIALRMLRAKSYDLLLTDCHMPIMDGVGLTLAVRGDANASLRALPVIGLTADVTEAQRVRCEQAGMNELAIKPLTIEKLSKLLHRYTADHARAPGRDQQGTARGVSNPAMHPG